MKLGFVGFDGVGGIAGEVPEDDDFVEVGITAKDDGVFRGLHGAGPIFAPAFGLICADDVIGDGSGGSSNPIAAHEEGLAAECGVSKRVSGGGGVVVAGDGGIDALVEVAHDEVGACDGDASCDRVGEGGGGERIPALEGDVGPDAWFEVVGGDEVVVSEEGGPAAIGAATYAGPVEASPDEGWVVGEAVVGCGGVI